MALFGGATAPNIEKLFAKRDVKGLLKALSYEGEDETALRQQAIRALGSLRAPQAVGPFLQMLEDTEPDPTIRLYLLWALGQIGDPQGFDYLNAALRDKNPQVYATAAQALGNMGDLRAAAELIESIQKRQEEVINVAFPALLQLGAKASVGDKNQLILEPLVKLLNHPSPAIRQAAMAGLEQLGWQPGHDASGISYYIARGEWDRCAALGEPAIQPLIDAMADENKERSQAAFGALLKIGLPAVRPLAIAMDAEHPAHRMAFWALVKMGTPAVEPLIAMLHDEQPALREASARVLGQIGDPLALSMLAEMATDGHWATREAACTALAKFGAPATQQLVAVLHSPHDDVRWIAANGLEKIGWQPEKNEGGALYCIAKGKWDQCAAMGTIAVPALITAIQHWDENVRKGAAWSLAHIGHPAVQPLIGVLGGDDPYAREAAARTLGQIGNTQAIEPLGAALKDDYAEVRQAAVGALVRLRAPVELFVPALKNEEPEVRKAAAWALGHSGNPNVVKPLVRALQDDDLSVKIMVIDALGELGSESAMQSLLSLMNDSTPEIRAAVSRATERISQT